MTYINMKSETVAIACKTMIEHIDNTRKEKREKAISEKLNQYTIFGNPRYATRAEAEASLNKSDGLYSESMVIDAYAENQRKKCSKLIEMAKISEIMVVSLDDFSLFSSAIRT